MTTPRLILLVVLLVGVPLLSGCLQTRTGRPEDRVLENEQRRLRASDDDATPVRWMQIVIGSPPSQKLAGYLKTELIPGMPEETRNQYWVYDRDFDVVGRVSPRGMTWRRDPFGREQKLGNFHVKHAVLSILGHYEEIEINLVKMPPPA